MKFVFKWKNFFGKHRRLNRVQFDKLDLRIRISFVEIFRLRFDVSRRELELIVLDCGFSNFK